MARSYAHIYLTIWNDPDFRGLSPDGQWLYFVMLTHPTINSCGVIEWREKRLASLSEGMTVARLRAAAWELGQRRMIAVDPETEEAVVRSFVRHDGVLKTPNPSKGLVREHGAIASVRIMELVSREARRAAEENPDWKGLESAQPVLKQFVEPFQEGFVWVPDEFKAGSGENHPKTVEPFRLGSAVPNPYTLTPSVNTEGVQGESLSLIDCSASSAADASDERKKSIDDDFDDWYRRYPRKKGKADALKAYRAARRKKVPHADMVDGLEAQLAEFATRQPEHVPYPATWIRAGSWADEVAPAATSTAPSPHHPELDENGQWREPAPIPAHLMRRLPDPYAYGQDGTL